MANAIDTKLSAGEDIYLLARDNEERERLNAQHDILIENLGYVIHPAISKRLPENCRVADVAAGSGAWTLNAAEILSPGSHVDGYDISDAQFPKKHPDNVAFSTHNAKRPFPAELHGTYDMVHIRALVAALERDDWKLVLENLITLLKPGGALQWCEGDLSRLKALRSTDTVEQFQAIPRLLDAFHGVASQRTGYGVDALPGLFKDAGLRSVEADTLSNDRIPSTRTTFARTYVVAMFGWARNALGLSTDELEKWKTEVEKEIEAGAYIRGDTVVVVGTKPV